MVNHHWVGACGRLLVHTTARHRPHLEFRATSTTLCSALHLGHLLCDGCHDLDVKWSRRAVGIVSDTFLIWALWVQITT